MRFAERSQPQQKYAAESQRRLLKENVRWAQQTLGERPAGRLRAVLDSLTRDFSFSVERGEMLLINSNWYVTHTGLLRLARRKKCRGIHVEAVDALCDTMASRYVLKATVYPTKGSAGFVGYGDADPSNVSAVVRGAEMRVAETRAVNRALRKAYGIGICSVEEIGAAAPLPHDVMPPKARPAITNSNGNGHSNVDGHNVRDRLCQIIRQHKLDPELVKAYAVDFCGVEALKDAPRDQVEKFVQHLADSARNNREALSCQLNSYARKSQEVVA